MRGKSVLLIIGGGIAAYKSLELIRALKTRGCGVRAILTQAATAFVTPLSVASLSGEKVFTDLFSLTDFVDDLTERYSHGMRQRTVFAGALLHQPKVLIVDEPTVGLDPKSIRLLKDLLRRQARQGTTVFLSTHSLDVAQELADRIGIINHGRLIGCGTLEDLRKQADHVGTLEDVFLQLTEEEEAEAGAATG